MYTESRRKRDQRRERNSIRKKRNGKDFYEYSRGGRNKGNKAFEIRCYRRMQKISWTDRMTNEEVLERVLERRSLWKSIKKRRKEWRIGHILRHGGLLGLILEGMVDGKNHRARL